MNTLILNIFLAWKDMNILYDIKKLTCLFPISPWWLSPHWWGGSISTHPCSCTLCGHPQLQEEENGVSVFLFRSNNQGFCAGIFVLRDKLLTLCVELPHFGQGWHPCHPPVQSQKMALSKWINYMMRNNNKMCTQPGLHIHVCAPNQAFTCTCVLEVQARWWVHVSWLVLLWELCPREVFLSGACECVCACVCTCVC